MTDAFANWRNALAGSPPRIVEDEPWCGYFATQDRSSTVKAKHWPKIACAIWLDDAGFMQAERGGVPVPVSWVWPHCASRPISYETYQFWHTNKSWPEEAKAA